MLIDGRKMSKSEGNFFTVGDLMQRGYRPSSIRRLLVSAHYRAELNFTLAGLDEAARSVDRLLEFRRRLEESRVGASGAESSRLPGLVSTALADFEAAMDDDLNVAEAWAALFVLVREGNAELDRAGQRIPRRDADSALAAIASIDRVLAVLSLADLEQEAVPEELLSWIEEQLAQRTAARQDGDFARADEIRATLAEAGIEVEDSPSGSRWRRAKRG
jgi:cysteinyl-tRNA synthetase